MQVVFLSKFNKDLSKILLKTLLREIENTIINVEEAASIKDIVNLKKLKGHKAVYRIKIGDCRIGVFIENNTVEFARIVHRKDLYKIFP